MNPAAKRFSFLPFLLALGLLLGLIPAAAGAAEAPDPLVRGGYTVERLDPFKAGLATLQEPNSAGKSPTAETNHSNESITLQIRGVMYRPTAKTGKSPLIVLVHGNHTQCDLGTSPSCEVFKRNDEGYAYLGENLASWGYTVVSLDQDQLMSRQDGSFGKGMHARRLLTMALLDALYEANTAFTPETSDYNLPASLVGTIDFERIGLMGHSRGGDAVSSFIEYDRMRPSGRRYPLRGVISLAPVDYERHAPYGMPYMTIFGTCDGDVSNLQGARLYERSQYIQDDPYPRIQSSQVGGNHNWYNSVWFADGEDSNPSDEACATSKPNNLRLSGQAGSGASESYAKNGTDTVAGLPNKLDPSINTRISGDPARMGDQEKIGLATMAAFFRRYVGGEGAFEPYLTGQRASEGKTELPESACPTSESGKRIPCADRVANSFFAPADERLDVIRPDTENPLSSTALGTKLSAAGFANPYPKSGGVSPRPATTSSGIDWCDPEPEQTEPAQLGEGGYPEAAKPCPLPASSALGGQSGTRENGPVNQSYGRQLSLAWQGPATLSTKIPAADADVSGYKALSMSAAVNFFDSRNQRAGEERVAYNPEVGKQNFAIALTDGHGHVATVAAGDARYGTALEQTTGSTSSKVHIILKDIRVPLADLAAQGIDLTDVTKLELRFGGSGMPSSGSIQLADVRFQESAEGTDVLLDSTAPNAGPAEGPPATGPNPKAELEAFDRSPAETALPDVTLQPGANVWTVDDDGVQCPDAKFSSIQSAVNYASPWDTIVVCPGLYEEHSTPVSSAANPVQSGATNGLTITKPLKIKGAGAGLVTIRPASTSSLLGTEPYLRDGGGNVVTISRQSLGSSDFDENFVDISGVTIESPSAYVDAGVAFFNTSGRISDSVVGPLRRTSASTLASRPHGWGIIATNSLLGSGTGTIEREVTVDHTLVKGYQTGGILFDNASGKDDNTAAVTTASAIKEHGYVTDTVVEGSGASTEIPQTGIQYHAGAAGFVEDSKVSGNLFTTEKRKSVGILLTGAETGDWYAKGTLLAGNGYGLFNADITNATVREAAPALAIGNFWGTSGTPIVGPSAIGATDEEGISGEDAGPNPSVTFSPVASSAPTITAPGSVSDVAPTAEVVEPGTGEEVVSGTAIEPVVLAEDDFGVKSVALTADGVPVATMAEAPYVFSWTPSAADVGKTVTLEATVTDSSGQATTGTVGVAVKAPPVTPIEVPVEKPVEKVTPPGNAITLGKVKQLTKKGIAMLKVTVPAPGKLVLSGPKVKTVTLNPTAAGEQAITVRPTGKALASLKKRGKVSVRVKLVFTPTGGTPSTTGKTVVLIQK